MKSVTLAFVLAVGLTWLVAASPAQAGQGCCCPACCQTYGSYYPTYQGQIGVYQSTRRSVPQAPQYRSYYQGHHRSYSARGEYWERQYGPFGPRGFDW